jgi:L,D-transpeptidase catalytic domain
MIAIQSNPRKADPIMLRPVGAKNSGRRAVRPISLAAASVAVFALMVPPDYAFAQDAWFGFGASPQRRPVKLRHTLARTARQSEDRADSQQKHKRGNAAAEKDKPATGPLFAVLSLSDQHISIYNSSGLVTRGKVSTGMPGHRTPAGIFSIIGQERYHNSNIYSGAPMPFMQRITWSGIALHLGVVPGYPASHGCIRLPAAFAQKLWGMTKIGERVVISPHEVAPADIAHPLLPVPKMQASPALVTENAPVKVTEVATTANEVPPVAAPKMLNPIEYAQALKARAAADVASAAKAVKELSDRAGAKSEEARKAVAALRAAETARAQAEARLAAKTRALESADSPAARKSIGAAKTAAEARLIEATKTFDAANSGEGLKTPEAQEALEAERALIKARATLASAQTTAKEAARRNAPVSILVSKKDKRIYIRQGLAPVLDAPAVIRDPEVPLGTHVYIASSLQNDGLSLGWTAVSLPSSTPAGEPRGSRRGQETGRDRNAARTEAVSTGSSAAQALERIEVPKDVSARISELLWIGGSLIISDQPLSNETSDIGTDIVVTTR